MCIRTVRISRLLKTAFQFWNQHNSGLCRAILQLFVYFSWQHCQGQVFSCTKSELVSYLCLVRDHSCFTLELFCETENQESIHCHQEILFVTDQHDLGEILIQSIKITPVNGFNHFFNDREVQNRQPDCVNYPQFSSVWLHILSRYQRIMDAPIELLCYSNTVYSQNPHGRYKIRANGKKKRIWRHKNRRKILLQLRVICWAFTKSWRE